MNTISGRVVVRCMLELSPPTLLHTVKYAIPYVFICACLVLLVPEQEIQN